MRSNFEINSLLQYRVKALEREVARLKSGEKYQEMEAYFHKELAIFLLLLEGVNNIYN